MGRPGIFNPQRGFGFPRLAAKWKVVIHDDTPLLAAGWLTFSFHSQRQQNAFVAAGRQKRGFAGLTNGYELGAFN